MKGEKQMAARFGPLNGRVPLRADSAVGLAAPLNRMLADWVPPNSIFVSTRSTAMPLATSRTSDGATIGATRAAVTLSPGADKARNGGLYRDIATAAATVSGWAIQKIPRGNLAR